MKKIGILGMAMLFTTGVAVAGESMTQSERNMKEKTTQSTTTMQGNADQTGEVKHKSTTMEKQQQTTASDDMDGDATTRERVEVERKGSTTTTDSSDAVAPGSTQEYLQSETHHQHSTTEVEKK